MKQAIWVTDRFGTKEDKKSKLYKVYKFHYHTLSRMLPGPNPDNLRRTSSGCCSNALLAILSLVCLRSSSSTSCSA
jgi:hypothetical protein